ncbi:MAG: hypothetical protein QF718_09975 [Phycisphaerales bacterium]|jgi:hypothetical protein|nr:hypothetical protein [Phycisphaerales bacterium]
MIDLDALTCKYLGLPSTNDHRRLLGLPSGLIDETIVNRSLRRRLAQLHVHPNGRSEEAIEVSSYLKRIAADIKQSVPKIAQSDEPHPDMTPLDQAILAALIGEGGWNRRCRARLVAIAASFSITVGGLMRILEALAESARGGTGPLSVKQRSTYDISRKWTTVPAKRSAISVVEEFVSRTAKKITPDLSSPSPIMTVRLALLFGSLTILAFILSLQILLSPDETKSTLSTIDLEIADKGGLDSEQNVLSNLMPKPYDTFPTFIFELVGNQSIEESDKAVLLSRNLSQLALKIREARLRGTRTQDKWLEEWKEAIDVISLGWPYIEESLLVSITTDLINVLVQAEYDQQFIGSLIEVAKPSRLHMRSPSETISFPWKVGFIAKISNSQRLGSSIQALARKSQLSKIPLVPEKEARLLEIDSIANQLVELTEIDNRVLHFWELWLDVVIRLKDPLVRSERFMKVIETIIDSEVDLSRDSTTRDVLGRIVDEVDWIKGKVLLDGILELYRSERVGSEDLWVLSKMLNDVDSCSWFADQYLVHPNSTSSEKKEIAKVIEREWPIDNSTQKAVWNLTLPAGFSPEKIESWKKRMADATTGEMDYSNLVKIRLINEAAVYIWRGRPDLANECFVKYDNFKINSHVLADKEVYLKDGDFTDEFSGKRRANTDKELSQINALNYLLENKVTDLGIRDSKTIARASLANLSTKIRNLATEVIVDQLYNSKNVAVAIIHEIPNAKSQQQLLKLIANLTEATLPDRSSPRWTNEARRALVQHALAVSNKEYRELDLISNELTNSLIDEMLFLNPATMLPSEDISSVKAFELLVEQWQQDLTAFGELPRTGWFNPIGVLQEYLQYQLEYARMLKIDEARWRNMESSSHYVNKLDISRITSKNIIEQLQFAEIAIANNWDKLMSELLVENRRRNERSK